MFSGVSGGDEERSDEEFELEISDVYVAWAETWAENGVT